MVRNKKTKVFRFWNRQWNMRGIICVAPTAGRTRSVCVCQTFDLVIRQHCVSQIRGSSKKSFLADTAWAAAATAAGVVCHIRWQWTENWVIALGDFWCHISEFIWHLILKKSVAQNVPIGVKWSAAAPVAAPPVVVPTSIMLAGSWLCDCPTVRTVRNVIGHQATKHNRERQPSRDQANQLGHNFVGAPTLTAIFASLVLWSGAKAMH